MVLLDADYQHNPDDIPDLINPISDGFDIIIGSRQKHKGEIPRYRRIGQRVISGFSRILSRNKISDTESGFRGFFQEGYSYARSEGKWDGDIGRDDS